LKVVSESSLNVIKWQCTEN